MKILITGATGFVGRNLVPYLFSHGFVELAIAVRDPQKAISMFESIPLTYISCERTFRQQIIDFAPEVVIHLATNFNFHSDEKSVRDIVVANILFGSLLLEAVSYTPCKFFINLGTFAEYYYNDGNFLPNTFYAATKTAFRSIIQYYQLKGDFKWINLIGYTIYGKKNDSKKIIDYLIDALNSPIPLNFTKGEQINDFIHINDVSDFFYVLLSNLNLLEDTMYTQLYLGTGKGTSIRELSYIIETVYKQKVNANWGGLSYRPYDIMYAVAPISRNLDLLKWKTKISLEEGIKMLRYE